MSNHDNISVEILHKDIKIPPTVMIGRQDSQSDYNRVDVNFTVHRSGIYSISVLLDGKHIQDSPFRKQFESGTVYFVQLGTIYFIN